MERDLEQLAARFVEMLKTEDVTYNEFVHVLMFRMDNGLTPKILRLLDDKTRLPLLKDLKDYAENEGIYVSSIGCCQFDSEIRESFLGWLAKCSEGIIEDVRMTTTKVLN